VIERAVILSPGEFIESGHVPADLSGPPPPSMQSVGLTAGMTVEEAERKLIELTLVHTRDNKTRAAEILGVTVKTLHNKLKRFRRETEKP
jgi:DNA-binding NtrC family response regulator